MTTSATAYGLSWGLSRATRERPEVQFTINCADPERGSAVWARAREAALTAAANHGASARIVVSGDMREPHASSTIITVDVATLHGGPMHRAVLDDVYRAVGRVLDESTKGDV